MDTFRYFILAHAVDASSHAHGSWLTQWNWDPLILPSLTLMSVLYATGLRVMWRRAGAGHGVTRGQAAGFAVAMAALVAALISPIDGLSNEQAWVHMIQHMLIMMVAAPLFVLGAPLRVMPWALPARGRLSLGRWQHAFNRWPPRPYLLWQPIAMWFLYAVALWVWHVPALYEAALHHNLIHDAQHLTFFIASCLFWRVLLDPLSRLRLNLGLGVIYLFATSLHASVLGVLLALSPAAWYAPYQATAARWPLSALEDQQVAGLIMWMPVCTIHAAVAAAMFALWMRQMQRTQAPALVRTP
ncbi:MAG: cytochrome c oxidase assembly protein [Phycisphaeraceae bacterium]